jgi:hypothetical protein
MIVAHIRHRWGIGSDVIDFQASSTVMLADLLAVPIRSFAAAVQTKQSVTAPSVCVVSFENTPRRT